MRVQWTIGFIALVGSMALMAAEASEYPCESPDPFVDPYSYDYSYDDVTGQHSDYQHDFEADYSSENPFQHPNDVHAESQWLHEISKWMHGYDSEQHGKANAFLLQSERGYSKRFWESLLEVARNANYPNREGWKPFIQERLRCFEAGYDPSSRYEMARRAINNGSAELLKEVLESKRPDDDELSQSLLDNHAFNVALNEHSLIPHEDRWRMYNVMELRNRQWNAQYYDSSSRENRAWLAIQQDDYNEVERILKEHYPEELPPNADRQLQLKELRDLCDFASEMNTDWIRPDHSIADATQAEKRKAILSLLCARHEAIKNPELVAERKRMENRRRDRARKPLSRLL